MSDEIFDNPDEKLEDALAMLAAGISLEEVLVEAANDAGWLRPLLELATEVSELKKAIPVPSPEASRQRLLDYGQALAGTSQPAISTQSDGSATLSKLFKKWWSRLFIGVVAVLLIVAIYRLITMTSAVIESISPAETALPPSMVTSTPTILPVVIETSTPLTRPPDVRESTATPTVPPSPGAPTATTRAVINSTSDTIKLPAVPTSTVTATRPFIKPTATEPLPRDDSDGAGTGVEATADAEPEGLDNTASPTPTETATVDSPEDGGDNTNENENNDGASNDNDNDNTNDNTNENDDDSDGENSGPGGGDDRSEEDDNSGSGSSGKDEDNSGSGDEADDDDD